MPQDVIGPDQGCKSTDALENALRVVDGFASEAARLELGGVTRADVDRLVEAGVLTVGPDAPLDPAQAREVHERLAAASGALWFVVTQHRSPAEAARGTENATLRQHYAEGLSSGQLLGAVAFAHLRRPKATVIAERREVGWSISGRLDWITSWGLADVLLLMAETPDGQVVQMLLPAHETEGLSTIGELSLAAMAGTSTVGAVLDELLVPDAAVAAIVPKADWLEADAHRTANVPAAVVGLARAALGSLLDIATQRQWSELQRLGEVWRDQLVADRARAYELLDDVEADQLVEERLSLRASITKLAQDATSMLVVAQAGRAMMTSAAAQRWAREAMFSLVQAQTPVTRNALVAEYLAGVTDPAAR